MTEHPAPPPARQAAPAGHGGAGRWAASSARVVALVLSVVVVIGTGYAWTNVRNLTDNVGRVGSIGLGSGTDAQAAGSDGKDQNILLVGLDDRTGATPAELEELSTQTDGGSMNTDTMMVLHVPADGARATVISLPRDSWVDIKGSGKGKLNSAYGDGFANGGGQAGGFKLLTSTIEGITGLTIDHYIAVSLLAFYRISKAIGGVPVCLTEAQNASTDSDANGSGYSGIDLPAGVSTIEGKQALAFVRQRHGLPRGDLDRIVRQQYFLSHAFAKVASAGTLLNPFALSRLIKAVSSSMTVDKDLDLLQLAGQVQGLTAGNITFATIPTLGIQNTTNGIGQTVSIVALDFAAIPAFVAQVVGQPSAYESAPAADPTSVPVTVVNAVGTSGLAGRNGDALAALGFQVGAPDSADQTVTTTVTYPKGMEAQAKAVAAAVPGAVPAVSPDATGVTLVLGTDGVQVPDGTAAAPSTATPTTTAAPAPSAASPVPPVAAPALADCIS